MPLTSGNKIENNGATPQGKLSAAEYNEVVQQINANERAIEDLDGAVVKSLKLNGTTYYPADGLIEASVAVGTTMNVAAKKRSIVAKLGSPIFLEYSFMSKNELGSTGRGEAVYYFERTSNQPLATAEIDQSSAVDDYSVRFEVTDYIKAVGSYTFIVVVRDSQGNQNEIRYTVEAIDFTIKNLLAQNQTFALNSQIPYRYGIVGSGSADKTVFFSIKKRGSSNSVSAGSVEVRGSDTANLGFTINPSNIPITWEHGAYTLSVYATIADGEDTIVSNTIELDLMITQEGNTTPIVSILRDIEAGFNNTARVYDTISSTIVIYVPGAEGGILTPHVNNKALPSIHLDNLVPYQWHYTIEEEDPALSLWVNCGVTEAYLPNITVSGRLVNVEETTLGLALKLSSKGRSNEEADRNIWRSESELYGNYQAQLTGFNWSSNGWIDDEDGARALHLSNGARVEIPFKVFGTDANTVIHDTGRTIEFEFKISNATNYLDTTRPISCYVGNVGFYVTPKMVYFQNSIGSASALSTFFKEGERIRVGLVFQSLVEGGGMYLYLNGRQSAYYPYEQSHSFRQATPSNIIIDSTHCDIDIYRILVYNSALTKTQMVNNLITGKDSVSEMLTVYNRNNIFYNGSLSPTLLQDQLPVMIMTANGLHAWMTQANIDKNMKILVDIEFVDKADPRRSFIASGVTLQFQGTSSMGYPVRNFKIKFKGATLSGDPAFISGYKYRLRETSFAVNTFCLKADFAESSGSHNTGSARLINSVLTNAVSGSSHPYLTPPQAAYNGTNDVRTTVDGFPIVLFSRETPTGDATFVGKYNFNNDKSTQEVFGFEGVEGFNSDLTNRTDILPEADDYRTSTGDINSRSTINPCECWEFKTNDMDLCKFKFDTEDELTHDLLCDAFESRYPEKYKAPSGSDIATNYEDTLWGHYELKKVLMWVHSTDTIQATGNRLPVAANYNGVTYLNDTAAYRLAKFKAEVSEHFNLNNLLSYFLLTDFLGAVDQRAKNQMMASWGNEGSGDFKWYFIFYDNDTVLGINNTGKIVHDYDLTSDTVGGYSGRDSVLWLNLEACFYNELCQAWNNLLTASEGSNAMLSYENLINEYNTIQSDKWAESVFNEDSNYKYVYQGGAATKDADYYEVLQGSRAEHRKYWIANRLEWINGKYKSKNFMAEGTGWRCNKVDGLNSSESIKLTFKGARKQYFGYIIGNTTNEVFLLNDENDERFCEYDGGWDYTNLNLAGEEYITDFGDISHQLPSDMKLAKMTRLKRLVVSSEQFPNTYLTTLSLTNKPFLEYLDISYASNLSAISDYGNCYRMKKVYAFHSGLVEAPFADGADVDYAELPNTLTTLHLRNLPYLTFDNLKMQDNDYSSITSLQVENCPCIQPLTLFEKVCNNADLSHVILLDIDQTVRYADTTIPNLVALATNTSIPANENRITGVLRTDAISNLHLGILEAKYPNLRIIYNTLVLTVNIMVSSNNVFKVYEGQTQQMSAAIVGDNSFSDIEWSIQSGQQYASIDQNGLLTATEQRNNRSYTETVVVRATLKTSRYVYTDYEIEIEGIAATGGKIEGDTWLDSQDASVMPVVSNNRLVLTPENCTKRASQITWHKNPSDPNYGLYEIDVNSGEITFQAVKTLPGMPTTRQNEFTIQIYAEYRVFEASMRTDKTLYVDYPNVGDFVYSNGTHSSKLYRAECEAGTLTLIGVCYYVNDNRTDRRMCATKSGGTMMWGVYGYDTPLTNKGTPYVRPDNSNGGWGTEWKSYWLNGIDLGLQNINTAIAAGDMNGQANTQCLIEERIINGYETLNDVNDFSNVQQEYPAASYCRVYGDNSWTIGKKGEWWLPSAGELLLLYQNLHWRTDAHPNAAYDKLRSVPSTLWTTFPSWRHWSSSESNSGSAVLVTFSDGGLFSEYKGTNYYVRAVSAF